MRDPLKDRAATERPGTRLKDALEFLLETPGVEQRRVGFGAFQAATPRGHEGYLLGRKLDAVEMGKVAAELAASNPITMIAGWKGAFLFPFGTSDPLVPKARAEEFFGAAAGEKKNAVLGGRAGAERAGGEGSRGVAARWVRVALHYREIRTGSRVGLATCRRPS